MQAIKPLLTGPENPLESPLRIWRRDPGKLSSWLKMGITCICPLIATERIVTSWNHCMSPDRKCPLILSPDRVRSKSSDLITMVALA